MRIFLSLVVFSVLCGSCDSERIFENNVEFRDRNWKIAQSVQFEFQIADTSRRYNLWMNIRNSLDYPYARIFVNYDLQKDSTTLTKKMIAAYLFDQKTGKPFGNTGLGDIYDHQFPILKNYSFDKAGVYKIRLNQFI